MSDGEEDSQEEATVSVEGAVGQAISSTAMAVAYSGDTLKERRDNIIKHYEQEGEILQDELRVFVVFTYAIIEEYSAQMLRKYVIKGRFASDAYEYLYDDMSQAHRENLLQACGIYGDTIIGHIGNFRGLRNTIAHEPYAPIDWEKDDIEPRMNQAIDVIDRLYAALTDDELVEEALNDNGL